MEEVVTENQPIEPQKQNYIKLPKWLAIAGIIVVMLVIAVLLLIAGMMLGKNQNIVPKAASSPTPTVTVPSFPTVASTKTIPQFPTITNPNLKRFISDKLGVTFTYLIDQNGQTISTQEIGNRVYVYFAKTQATTGQFLVMMNKDKNQTLEQAIREQVLKGYSTNDCLIKPVTQYVPKGFNALSIVVPVGENETMEEIQAKVQKCPTGFTAMGGMAYFIEDPSHPDKMIFLSIGQYLINSEGDNQGWQDTLQLF